MQKKVCNDTVEWADPPLICIYLTKSDKRKNPIVVQIRQQTFLYTLVEGFEVQ